MTAATKWSQKIVFLISPEDSFTSLPSEREALFPPASGPTGWGILKTLLWIAISIGFAFLIARHF